MIERYTLPKMGKIWEPQNRFAKWLQVEILVCEAMAKEGMIPEKSLDTIKKKARFSIDRIQEIEEEVKHDVIAFLTNVEEYVGHDARFIHMGLTSSDILEKHLDLWNLKARPPPRADAPPKSGEQWLDYSDSQLPASYDYLYADERSA